MKETQEGDSKYTLNKHAKQQKVSELPSSVLGIDKRGNIPEHP